MLSQELVLGTDMTFESSLFKNKNNFCPGAHSFSTSAGLDEGAWVEKGGWTQTGSETLSKGPLRSYVQGGDMHACWLCPSLCRGGHL